MRDNRFDGPPIVTDITEKVRSYNVFDMYPITRTPRDRKKATQSKASRRKNR